jgi:hypothetical protein
VCKPLGYESLVRQIIYDIISLKFILGKKTVNLIKLMNSALWTITPCSPLNVNRCFGGIYHLHLQDLRISQARNQNVAGSKQLNLCLGSVAIVYVTNDEYIILNIPILFYCISVVYILLQDK